jgi:hypothetical protein
MKITYFETDDFRAAITPDSTVLYDLTVESSANPLPVARITFSLFGVSCAGDIVEYYDNKRISILSIVGDNFEDAVNEALKTYRTFASEEFGAKPGRYEELPNAGRPGLSPATVSAILHRLDRLDDEYADLSCRLTRLAAGGCYDE